MLFLTILTVLFTVLTPVLSTPLLNHGARALLSTPLHIRAISDLKNFQLPMIYTHTFSGVDGDDLNSTISFSWNDVNSNTNTICTTQWLCSDSPATTITGVQYPTSYIACDTMNPSSENWQWYFSSMTSIAEFQLTLAHEYTDPDAGPAPYDTVQVFATYNASLTCNDSNGLYGCYLPYLQSPATALVYGFD